MTTLVRLTALLNAVSFAQDYIPGSLLPMHMDDEFNQITNHLQLQEMSVSETHEAAQNVLDEDLAVLKIKEEPVEIPGELDRPSAANKEYTAYTIEQLM